LIRIEPTTLNGLQKTSCADTFQVRSVAQQRFMTKIGELSEIEMEAITKGLAVVLVI
jgi:mRNA interferase MazF